METFSLDYLAQIKFIQLLSDSPTLPETTTHTSIYKHLNSMFRAAFENMNNNFWNGYD
jgi:hypothetical protein